MASPQRAESPPTEAAPDRVPLAAGLDTAMVVVFVAAGRRTHDQDPGIQGLIETAAPFLIGLVLTWLVARAWRRPDQPVTGVVVAAGTVIFGMLLRRFVFDEGTAMSFVLVASAFIGATLVGWRVIVAAIDDWRARRAMLGR